MDTPLYSPKQYVNAVLLSNNDTALSKSVTAAMSALCGAGLIEYESLTLTPSLLTVSAVFGTSFIALFSSGLSQAHGTTPNADTQSYTANLASLVPGSGSVTAYIYITYFGLSMAPVTIVGPPIGHPNYDPTFVPYNAYTYTRDSFSVNAGLSVPAGSYEIARTTLSAGQTVISVLDQSHVIRASAYTTSLISVTKSISANYAVGSADVGKNIAITAASVTATLPAPSGGPAVTPAKGYSFVYQGATSNATVAISGGATFQGIGINGNTSISLAPGDYITVVDDGSNYRVVSASPNLAGAPATYAAINGNASKTFLVANSAASTAQAVPRSQADTLYAALAGLSTQVFSVANSSASTAQAVPRSQADTLYAALAGLATQTFLVANSSASTAQAVPRSQADTLYAALAGLGTQTFLVANSTASTQQAVPRSQADTLYNTGRLLNIQTFTSGTATYTPTTGTNTIIVEMVGGGGAGAGTGTTSSSQINTGAGGNGGAYAKARITSGFSGLTVTVGAAGAGVSNAAGGAGGSSSLGTLLVCAGGQGGGYLGPNVPGGGVGTYVGDTSAVTTSGATTLLYTRAGEGGQQGLGTSLSYYYGGRGGSSFFSPGTANVNSGNGNNAPNNGGGGGGASTGPSNVGTNYTGGNGGGGIVIIHEYA